MTPAATATKPASSTRSSSRASAAARPAAPTPELWLMNPRELVSNPLNPRRDVGKGDEFAELVASVKEHGIIEPLVAFVDEKGKTVLLAGDQRRAAALAAKLKEVPVIVRPEPTAAEQLEIMLDENDKRKNLHPIEEGNAYVALLELGRSQVEIAKKCSVSESHVSKRLAIVKLPDAVLDRFDRGDLTLEAAYELTKLGDNEKAQTKIAGQLSPELIKQSVRNEVAKAKHAKTKERLEARVAKEGVPVMSVKQLDNHTVAALAGQDAGYHDVRLAIGVAEHKGESCHAAVIRPGQVGGWNESPPSLIYVCNDPSGHKDVATVKFLSGAASVDQIKQRAATSTPSSRSVAAYEPPKQSAAEKKKIAALQKAFDATLATAEKRRAHLSAHIRTVSKHTLLPLLEAAIVVGFTDEGYYGVELCAPEITWAFVEADVDAIGDDQAEILLNAGLVDEGANSWLVATSMAIAMFERTLFTVPYGRESFTVESATQTAELWRGKEDPRALAIYLDWVASTGWEITSAETDVLEACWTRYRKYNPEQPPVDAAGLLVGDEIAGTDGAMSVSDEGTGQADDE